MRSHHFLYTFAAGDLFFAVMNFFQGMYGVGILVALAGIGALLLAYYLQQRGRS
jgi:hypothetical protein